MWATKLFPSTSFIFLSKRLASAHSDDDRKPSQCPPPKKRKKIICIMRLKSSRSGGGSREINPTAETLKYLSSARFSWAAISMVPSPLVKAAKKLKWHCRGGWREMQEKMERLSKCCQREGVQLDSLVLEVRVRAPERRDSLLHIARSSAVCLLQLKIWASLCRLHQCS